MSEIRIGIEQALLSGLLDRQEGLARLLENVLNQILEAHMTAHLGAARHERSAARAGYRNGYRTRTLRTRVGTLHLRVPQTRTGSSATALLRRYQRHEQAFTLALMEMVVQGVSTRKVGAVTEALCGEPCARSTVSALCAGLDERVRAFNERPLADEAYPFLFADALHIHCRTHGQVRRRAVMIVSGVRRDGVREILGLRMGDSESFVSWNDTFQWLKRRGLHGVDIVVSDQHGGLRAALRHALPTARWQRCQVHLMRNVLGASRARKRGELAHAARAVLHAPDMAQAQQQLVRFLHRYRRTAPAAAHCLATGFADAMTVMALPEPYRRRLRSTNMQERLNEEVRRRERVIRVFPSEASALRLIAAQLAAQHARWQGEGGYLDMGAYHAWRTHAPWAVTEKTTLPPPGQIYSRFWT